MQKYLHNVGMIAGGATVIVATLALPFSSAFAQVLPTTAAVNVTASATVNTPAASATVGGKITAKAKILATAQTRADQEITRRINALNALSARVNAMAKVSESDKASLQGTIQTEITAMNNLQAQIEADGAANSTSSLKADIQSITKSYRIFALVIPQGAIEAAADRILDIAQMMTTLSGQLQTRITTTQASGANLSAAVSALADLNTQVGNANAQANAGTSEVASLQPDNGNQTVMASNTAALKDARSKIQAAQADLATARKDAGVIVKALLAIKGSTSSTTSVSATATASTTAQ